MVRFYRGNSTLNDHTDDLHISFSGISNTLNHHRPFIKDLYHNSFDFIEEFIEGYSFAYDRVSEKKTQILNKLSWWEEVSQAQSRSVQRETSTYFYLLRKIQQPEYCISRNKAEKMLRKKLRNTMHTEYEVEDLLELNIPYFYRRPGEKHLYDGKDNCYANVFPGTAIDRMKEQFSNRSEREKRRDCALIRKHCVLQSASNHNL